MYWDQNTTTTLYGDNNTFPETEFSQLQGGHEYIYEAPTQYTSSPEQQQEFYMAPQSGMVYTGGPTAPSSYYGSYGNEGNSSSTGNSRAGLATSPNRKHGKHHSEEKSGRGSSGGGSGKKSSDKQKSGHDSHVDSKSKSKPPKSGGRGSKN